MSPSWPQYTPLPTALGGGQLLGAVGAAGLALWYMGGPQALSLVMSWICGERRGEYSEPLNR